MVKTESRTKNSSRNLIFSMLAYIIQIVLGFLVRRYFIYYFNEEYLGLNSLFTNVLSLLSLAELGFGGAIVFAMYKPMAEGDEEKVRQLLYFYKKCYLMIGLIILGIGLCVLPFMDYFKKQAPNVDVNLYVIYLINLFNTVISYFFAHRRSLLYTNQRNDIESKINMVINIALTGMQLVVLIFVRNYYLYISLTGITTILSNALIFFVTQKLYKNYLRKPEAYLDKESKREINKNICAMVTMPTVVPINSISFPIMKIIIIILTGAVMITPIVHITAQSKAETSLFNLCIFHFSLILFYKLNTFILS